MLISTCSVRCCVPLLVLVCTSGCLQHSVDPQQYRDALDRVDRLIDATDKARRELGIVSDSWRKTLPELEAKLIADGQDVLAHDIHFLAASLIGDLRETPKEILDYAEVKIKDNLKAFRISLDRARAKILSAEQDSNESGIKEALDELARVQVFHEPVVTQFNEKAVELHWRDHTQTACQTRTPLIQVRGWGFERPTGESPRFRVAVVNEHKKERLLPPATLCMQTRYLMMLDLTGVGFRPDDRQLVLALGPFDADRRVLPIRHVIPAVVPPEDQPEVITSVVVTIQTPGGKSDQARVTWKLFDEASVLVHDRGWVGESAWWGLNSTRTPYRTGKPDPELVDRFEKAPRLPHFPPTAREENIDESRRIEPAKLTRPIPVVRNRTCRLLVELQACRAAAHVGLAASLRVVLHTSKGRLLEFQSPEHLFSTTNDTRFYKFDFDLPTPTR